MNHSFNLLDEPWIPCMFSDGRVEALGLERTLAEAHDIVRVSDPFPPVTVAIHRLLLTVLHRCCGPGSLDDWNDLYKRGRLDRATLIDYLGKWRQRFDLFDEETPFYQSPTLVPAEDGRPGYQPGPLAKLALAFAAGNNVTLFDHSLDDDPAAFPPADCALFLVACQACHPGGLVSRLPGGRRSAQAAPLAKGAAVIYQGDTLFETLISNLLTPRYAPSFPGRGRADCPAWERPPVADDQLRQAAGYLDYLTWQGFRVRLLPEATADGRTVVRRAILAAGRQLEREEPMEPMFAHRPRPEDRKGPAWLAVRLGAERVVWRDSTALFAAVQRTGGRRGRPLPQLPRALLQLGDLVQYGYIPRSRAYRVVVCGLVSDQAKIDLWREEHIPVVAAYFADPDLSSYLQRAVEAGEQAGGWIFAAIGPDRKRRGLLDQLASSALRHYWARLEPRFLRLVDDLGRSATDGDLGGADPALAGWLTAVADTATAAFERAVASIEFNRRFVASLVRARQKLESRLTRLKGGRV